MGAKVRSDILLRHVEITDIPYLYDICFKTGFNGKDASEYYNDKYLLGQFYAVPYAVFAKEFSFVLLDNETKIPKGYVIGTGDTLSFEKNMAEKWLPSLKEQCSVNTNNKSEYEKSIKQTILNEIKINHSASELEMLKEYPAHFHIDMLPEMQGQGYGHDLIEHFLENLVQKNIKGVHLGVNKENERACHVYKKEGFEVLEEVEWGFVMGKKL